MAPGIPPALAQQHDSWISPDAVERRAKYQRKALGQVPETASFSGETLPEETPPSEGIVPPPTENEPVKEAETPAPPTPRVTPVEPAPSARTVAPVCKKESVDQNGMYWKPLFLHINMFGCVWVMNAFGTNNRITGA